MQSGYTVSTGNWLPCCITLDDGEDDYFEDGDLFFRLEEIRAHLEKELGLEILIKAYQTVQVLMGLNLQCERLCKFLLDTTAVSVS